MATLAEIREKIRLKLAGVAAIGLVHDYERYADVESKLKAQYQFDAGGGVKRLQGWFVSWRGRDEVSPGNGRYALTERWEIRGFWALNDADASEKAFDNKIEEICDAFRLDENLGGTVSSTVIGEGDAPGPAGVQVREKIPVLFCGVLAHSARCELFTRHYR